MATNLPPFLLNYLLNRGLFSSRFSTPEDTQETPKKEQELTFEKVLQDILDGGLDREDTTSVSSAPSSATPSTGSLGLGNIGGLFGDIEQALDAALSFDLEQAAIDAVEQATGFDFGFEGLFGIETPSFISDIQQATPGAVTSAIMSSPNQSLGAKIGALGFNLLSPLTPFGITAFGTAMNALGASDPFDPAVDVAINYDPVADVTTISRSPEALADEEPDVARSELGMAFDIADLMSAEQRGAIEGMSMFGIGTEPYSAFDWADPGFGVGKAIDPVDPLSEITFSTPDVSGYGGLGAPGAFASQPDPTSPFGYAPDYHSPSFDPSNYDTSDPDMSFDDPSYDPGFDEPGGYGGAAGPGGDDGGGDGGGDGKVICTALKDMGLLDEELWQHDGAYGRTLPLETRQGYWKWGVPTAKFIRKNRWAAKAIRPVVTEVAKEMAHRVGYGKGSKIGSALLYVGLPLCRVISRIKNNKNNTEPVYT